MEVRRRDSGWGYVRGRRCLGPRRRAEEVWRGLERGSCRGGGKKHGRVGYGRVGKGVGKGAGTGRKLKLGGMRAYT